MAIRQGKDYLERIANDGREVWCDGVRVADVTTDPRFSGGARTMAELYDLQHDPKLTPILTEKAAEGDGIFGLSHKQPRTTEDLVKRRKMVKVWNDHTCGMFGRSPDFMNVMIAAYAAAYEAFDSGESKLGKNVLAFHRMIRDQDLSSTHALVSPQIDRTKGIDLQQKDIAARIISENDRGFVINGARMLATLAAIADEIVVMPAPSYPLSDSEEAKAHAFGFAIPVATKGLRLIARPTTGHLNSGSNMDFPLASRLDDSDCMVVFDHVEVPWERAFIYRDVDVYNGVQRTTQVSVQTSHQFATKDLAKAEFMRDLATFLAHSTNVDQFLHIQNGLAELINCVEFVYSCIVTAEKECQPGPGGTVIPRREPLQAVKFMFPPQFRRACEIIQIIGAGGLFANPSYAMFNSDLKGDIEKYFQSANLESRERIRLFRLAVDAAVSSFSGRQQLYERFFAGDPIRASANYAKTFDKNHSIERITSLLDRWESEEKN
ncbi:MAG: 4-hydroxyphenylacetate 3-hydroxylase N-terminal domain-containing protein [Rhodospirillaceae bacterium]